MLNINTDNNMLFYFEFYVNYLNQFDVTALDRYELLLFNDFFFKNFLIVFCNSELVKFFMYFNSTISNNEFFILLINFLDIKEFFNLEIYSDIEENLFMYIYIMDLFIELNVIYSFMLSSLFFLPSYITINIETEYSTLFLVDMIYYNSLYYLFNYDILNLKLYFSYVDKYNLDNTILFYYQGLFVLILLLLAHVIRVSGLDAKFDLFSYKL
jgi:hypothetical protein